MQDRNMSLGLYSDMGTKTCAGYPGSEGFEVCVCACVCVC